jgi:hypothetical protein
MDNSKLDEISKVVSKIESKLENFISTIQSNSNLQEKSMKLMTAVENLNEQNGILKECLEIERLNSEELKLKLELTKEQVRI